MKNYILGWMLLSLCLISLPSSTAFGQAVTLSDSTVCVPLWRARLIQADLERKDALDTIVAGQAHELRLSLKVIAALDSLLTTKDLKFNNLQKINTNLNLVDSIRSEQLEARDKKKKKLKVHRAMAVVGGIVITLIALL